MDSKTIHFNLYRYKENLANIRNIQLAESNYGDSEIFKSCTMHILDGYLNENIGGVPSMQRYIINNILVDYSIYYIIEENYHTSLWKLVFFLYYSNKKTAFMFFGTNVHTTMLHFVKNEDSFEVTYINPGEGYIPNNEQIINDNTYCNIFNKIIIPNTHKLEFLVFIKVFIYYHYYSTNNNESIDKMKYVYGITESLNYIIPSLNIIPELYKENITAILNHSTKFKTHLQLEKQYEDEDQIYYVDNQSYTPVVMDVEQHYDNMWCAQFKSAFIPEEFGTFDLSQPSLVEKVTNRGCGLSSTHMIDISQVGNPNILYKEGDEPMYFRLGDIMISKIDGNIDNASIMMVNVNICGKSYKLYDLYIPFIQTNCRMNNLYILNPIKNINKVKNTAKCIDSHIMFISLKVINYKLSFSPIQIDNLNFTYKMDKNSPKVNINNLLISTCEIGSMINITLKDTNIDTYIQPGYTKLEIPNDFSMDRFQMFMNKNQKLRNISLKEWYFEMYELLKDKKNNYAYLDALFVDNRPPFSDKDEKLYNTSVNFLKLYELELNNDIIKQRFFDDKRVLKYYQAAKRIFTMVLDTKKKELIYKLFKSGTCVYMSLLGTILYHYLQSDNPDYLIFIYKKITDTGYTNLQKYINNDTINYHEFFTSVNYHFLINKLYEMGISSYTSREIINDYIGNQNGKVYYNLNINTNVEKINLEVCPYNDLISYVNKIREHNESSKETLLTNIVAKYNDLICKQQFPIFNIYEFLILGFLWEYYFNKSTWDPIIEEYYNPTLKSMIEGIGMSEQLSREDSNSIDEPNMNQPDWSNWSNPDVVNLKYKFISNMKVHIKNVCHSLYSIANTRIDVSYNECAWIETIINIIFNTYKQEHVIENNLIKFANLGEFELLKKYRFYDENKMKEYTFFDFFIFDFINIRNNDFDKLFNNKDKIYPNGNNIISELFNYITTNNYSNKFNIIIRNQQSKLTPETSENNDEQNSLKLLRKLENIDINNQYKVYNLPSHINLLEIFNTTKYLIQYFKELYNKKETLIISSKNILYILCNFIISYYNLFTRDELDHLIIIALTTFKQLQYENLNCVIYYYDKGKVDKEHSKQCEVLIKILNLISTDFFIINDVSPEYYAYRDSNIDINKKRCDKRDPLLTDLYRYVFTMDYRNNHNISKKIMILGSDIILNNLHTFLQNNPITIQSVNEFINIFNNLAETPLLKINKDTITYNYNNTEYVQPYKRVRYTKKSYPLSSYLVNNKKNIIYETNDHLIHILTTFYYFDSHNTMGKNKVIIMEKFNTPDGGYTINNTEYINLDGHNYKIINDIQEYPFLAWTPREALCLFKNNKLIVLFHTSDSNNNTTHKFVIDDGNEHFTYSYYGEFIIKSNYILPQYNTVTNSLLETMFKSDKIQRTVINFKPTENMVEIFKTKNITTYKPLFFEYLLNNLNKMKSHEQNLKIVDIVKLIEKRNKYVSELYDEVMSLKITNSNIDLLTWSEMVTINDDNTCSTICRNGQKKIDNCIKILDDLYTLLKLLTNKIDFTLGDNILEIMVNNIFQLSLIMQVNVYVKNIIMLMDIINNCTELACYKIRQINRSFIRKPVSLLEQILPFLPDNIKDKQLSVNISDILFEIIFGEIISSQQWELYKKILYDYNNKTRRVHQLMMGKGKSSVITPLLCFYLSLIKNEIINIIVPNHLKADTIKSFEEYNLITGIKPNILTDAELKEKALLTIDFSADFSDEIFLIDEFDSMYNPLQSNFNYVVSSDIVDKNILDVVFDISYDYYTKVNNIEINNNIAIIRTESRTTNFEQYTLQNEICKIIKDNSYQKNITFGQSNTSEIPFVIPYVRKDSPLEGSRFSMNLITFILTLKYMFNTKLNRFELTLKDVQYIANRHKPLFKQLCTNVGVEFDINNDINIMVSHVMLAFNIDKTSLTKDFIQKYYIFLFVESGSFKVSSVIKNISFIDIINMNCKWQVGYSGTVNLNLKIPPELPTLNKYVLDIEKDPDEEFGVRKGLTSSQKIINIKNADELFKEIIDFDVIIDNAAILKDYENEQVAEKIYEIRKTPVIYITKNDTKMIYSKNKHKIYVHSMVNLDEPLTYYYDQRHIVGTDFIQPPRLNGIVTIDSNSTRTNVAQAIYRMRKLNEGHTVTVCYNNTNINISINNSDDIYSMICKNEADFNTNIESLLYLQYLKYLIRSKTKYYFETDLRPIYTIDSSDLNNIFNIKVERNITTEHLHITKYSKDEKRAVLMLYNKLKILPPDKKIDLIFGTNSTETQQETQSESQVNIQIINEKERSYDIDFYTDFGMTIHNVYTFDGLLNTTLIILRYNDINLHISYTILTTLLYVQSGILFLPIYMKTTLTGFIMVPAIICDAYVDIYPLYNVKGQLINPDTINKVGKHVATFYEFNKMFIGNFVGEIQISNDGTTDTFTINLHELFKIDDENIIIPTININKNDILLLSAVYKIFSFLYNFSNNKQVISNIYLDIQRDFINAVIYMKLSTNHNIKEMFDNQYDSNTLCGIKIVDANKPLKYIIWLGNENILMIDR